MSIHFDIPDAALEFRFIQASGPGGQHVNKTSSAVELRVTLDLLGLDEPVVQRLYAQQRGKINKHGELVIQAEAFRSQLKNRKDALSRLTAMVQAAAVRPRKRIATKPSRNAKRRRLEAKKQRGRTKSQRKKPGLDA